MKTIKFIYAILFIICSLNINAQLKVETNGRVLCTNQTTIQSNPNNFTDGLDVVSTNTPLSTGLDLIWGCYYTTQPNNPGILTLQSVDGAYFSVRNNGKVGIFNNAPNEALEVGTAGTNYNVRINGNIVLTSDEKVKKNIKNIDNSLVKLKDLRSVTYNYTGIDESLLKTSENNLSDTLNKTKLPFKPKNNDKYKDRNYYGFVAQDVQKIFPDLVFADSAGVLGVDYIGIIPLLVNALNEQNEIIENQNKKIADIESRLTKIENGSTIKKIGSSNTGFDGLSYPVLEQNVPNPFNITTTIAYYLPNSYSKADIYIYDMNGTQLKTYPISNYGKSSIIIQASEFIAGMYLYALIADGNVIDTKRMILTK